MTVAVVAIVVVIVTVGFETNNSNVDMYNDRSRCKTDYDMW